MHEKDPLTMKLLIETFVESQVVGRRFFLFCIK